MQTSPLDTPRAACLTPPATGGVAVVQVVGRTAPALVTPLLHSKRPLNLETMNSSELRICRIIDGQEMIDDCLVCTRRLSERNAFVIDITVHGGPRIVQRVLLLLKKAGAQIVEPDSLLDVACLADDAITREAMHALLRVKTRPVAAWLLRNADLFAAEVQRVVNLLDAREMSAAQEALAALIASAARVRLLLDGIRIVLSGPPNVGKSTLANTLAAREHAIVSDVPGTTRDFVEIPAAIGGVPVTFVDTAGIRETSDPIEQEAIRRTLEQASAADLVLQLADASALNAMTASQPSRLAETADNPRPPMLRIWTKADQLRLKTPSTAEVQPAPLLVSAHTGQGLTDLRTSLLAAFGLTDWSRLVGPFTRTQTEALQASLDAYSRSPADPASARQILACLLQK